MRRTTKFRMVFLAVALLGGALATPLPDGRCAFHPADLPDAQHGHSGADAQRLGPRTEVQGRLSLCLSTTREFLSRRSHVPR